MVQRVAVAGKVAADVEVRAETRGQPLQLPLGTGQADDRRVKIADVLCQQRRRVTRRVEVPLEPKP